MKRLILASGVLSLLLASTVSAGPEQGNQSMTAADATVNEESPEMMFELTEMPTERSEFSAMEEGSNQPASKKDKSSDVSNEESPEMMFELTEMPTENSEFTTTK